MSASWIKQNMLGSPPKRTLTEAEMRVQRAIQKLDIPEWYLNKKSKAPKILKHNTPIDRRQPSWKRGVKSDTMSTSSLLENTSDPTGIYKTSSRLKTSMDESLLSGTYGTPRMFESPMKETPLSATTKNLEGDKSAMENSSPVEPHESTETAPRLDKTYVKPSRAKFSSNKSGTFPKVSPSRKVQNINIVFPPTSNSPVPPELPKSKPPQLPKSKPPLMPLVTSFNICDNTNLTSDTNVFNKTIESSFDNYLSGDDKFNTPRRRSACFKTNLANAIAPKPFSKQIGTPFETPVSDFKIRAHSTSDGTEQTLFTSALDKPTPSPRKAKFRGKTERILNFSSDSNKNNNDSDRKKSTFWLGEVKPFGSEFPKTCCQECGSKAPRIFAAVTTSSPNNYKQSFNEKIVSPKFMKIVEASGTRRSSASSSSDDDHREGQSASPLARFINSRNKPNELSNIIKEKQVHHGINLAEEIIQELKEKCTIKSKASYSSPRTRHFVNRLVNDLRGNINEVSEIPDEQEVEAECFDSDIGSRSSTDEDLNSAGFSTSISMSDSGSECALPVTSTLKSNAEKSRFSKTPIRTERTPFEEDGVFWIPITNFDLPGTSQLMNTTLKPSMNQIHSPSISPITVLSDNYQTDERIYRNTHEVSDSKQKEMMKSTKMQKGRILDSGYSDRSNVKSLGSDSTMSDRSWSEESHSSPAESENSFSFKTIGDRVFLGKKSGVYVL